MKYFTPVVVFSKFCTINKTVNEYPCWDNSAHYYRYTCRSTEIFITIYYIVWKLIIKLKKQKYQHILGNYCFECYGSFCNCQWENVVGLETLINWENENTSTIKMN